MDDNQSKAQTIDIAEVWTQWDQIMDCISQRHAPVIVQQNGVPVAAILSVADLERLQRIEADWDAPFAAIDRTRAAFSDVPDDDLEREVAKAVTDARAELRAEREAAGTRE